MIPSLARASSLGLFFFRKLWGGFLKEGRGHKFTGWLSGERLAPPPTPSFPLPSPPPFPWHLAGCTGTGTGPGRLWYMRMMLRISLLGSARQGSGSELRSTALPPAGLCPPPGPTSVAGSVSASRAALAAPCDGGGFFTTGGGGGEGPAQEERKDVRPCAEPRRPSLPPASLPPALCSSSSGSSSCTSAWGIFTLAGGFMVFTLLGCCPVNAPQIALSITFHLAHPSELPWWIRR